MHRRTALFALQLFFSAVASGPMIAYGQASPPVVIADRISCAACRIVLEKPVVLRTNTDAPISSSPTSVSVDRRGRFWLAEYGELARVYAPTGQFLQRIGRKGRGPNEFTNPFGFSPVPGDSMLVFDSGSQSASIVDPDLRPGRTIRFSGQMFPALPLKWPTDVLVNGIVNTASEVGLPLHVVSFATNDVVSKKSFGYEDGKLLPGDFTSILQRIAVSETGAIWSADVYQYRFSSWNRDGSRVQTYVRRPDWFASPSKNWLGNRTTPPPPRIVSIRQAIDGLLWVVVNVPSKKWAKAWAHVDRGAKDVAIKQVAMENLYSTYVEAIDANSKSVVARQLLEQFVTDVLPDGRLVTYSIDANDEPIVAIHAVKLNRGVAQKVSARRAGLSFNGGVR